MEGATFLSARTGAPIVPIGIGGSDLAMPKGSTIPKPYTIHVVIGPAVAGTTSDRGWARLPLGRPRRHGGAGAADAGRLRPGPGGHRPLLRPTVRPQLQGVQEWTGSLRIFHHVSATTRP